MFCLLFSNDFTLYSFFCTVIIHVNEDIISCSAVINKIIELYFMMLTVFKYNTFRNMPYPLHFVGIMACIVVTFFACWPTIYLHRYHFSQQCYPYLCTPPTDNDPHSSLCSQNIAGHTGSKLAKRKCIRGLVIYHPNGLAQDCSNSSTIAMEISHSH